MARRARGPVASLIASLAPAILAAGCGPLALIHDAYLGPISPAGYVHPLVLGENFRVTDTGPVVDVGDTALLRPFPRDLLARGEGFIPLTQGLEFAISGFSFIVVRDTSSGKPVPPESRARVHVGTTVAEALEALGPPRTWIKREGGSVMIYGSEAANEITLNLGVPPGVGSLVPIPGLSDLSFRYSSRTAAAERLILFFDADDALRTLVSRSDTP